MDMIYENNYTRLCGTLAGALIPELVAGAQSREAQMVEKGAREFAERPDTLEAIDRAIHGCRQCPIGGLDNQAVMGEGPVDGKAFSGLMIVGEQPGDQEDRQGRPFNASSHT